MVECGAQQRHGGQHVLPDVHGAVHACRALARLFEILCHRAGHGFER